MATKSGWRTPATKSGWRTPDHARVLGDMVESPILLLRGLASMEMLSPRQSHSAVAGGTWREGRLGIQPAEVSSPPLCLARTATVGGGGGARAQAAHTPAARALPRGVRARGGRQPANQGHCARSCGCEGGGGSGAPIWLAKLVEEGRGVSRLGLGRAGAGRAVRLVATVLIPARLDSAKLNARKRAARVQNGVGWR